MRIGLTGGGRDTDAVIRQAQLAEADGFSSLWYPGAVLGDPLVAIAARRAGDVDHRVRNLRRAVLHLPSRAAGEPVRVGRRGDRDPRASHRRCGAVARAGDAAARVRLPHAGTAHRRVRPDPRRVAARRAGRRGRRRVHRRRRTAGVGRWATDPRARERPRTAPAAGRRRVWRRHHLVDGERQGGGRPRRTPHHHGRERRRATRAAGRGRTPCRRARRRRRGPRHRRAREFVVYGTLPNYRRILAHGGISSPGDAAIVGDEASVAEQIAALFEAGATDFWAAPMPVGDDRSASRARTRALLQELAAS